MESFTAESWHGDRGALVAIFKPYVTEPSWFKYDEDMETFSVQPNLLAPLGEAQEGASQPVILTIGAGSCL